MRPFVLDGKMNLDISYGEVTMRTRVYIKMDAPEQLLLAEGVCRQFKIITYHPDVTGILGNTHLRRHQNGCTRTATIGRRSVPSV